MRGGFVKNSRKTSLSNSLLAAALALVLCCASAAWSQSFQTIYNFTGGTDGGFPIAGVVLDAQGNLYGDTLNGGGDCGLQEACGVVFQLTHNNNGTWSENVLHNFEGNGADGGNPTAPVAFDRHGNLYGASNCVQDCFFNTQGVLFQLLPQSNGPWRESILYNLQGDGCAPNSEYGTGGLVVCSVAFDHTGRLFAQTVTGGTTGPDCVSFGCGQVLFLGQVSVFSWYRIVLHDFMDGSSDGRFPEGLLAFDTSNNVYGTTGAGGSANAGTVYMLTPNHVTPGYRETLLHSFQGGSSDGANPTAGVVLDASGNVYGTTSEGGAAGLGMVYILTPQSNGTWSETVLYSLQGGNDAAMPNSSLTFDAAGNLYGTAGGGADNQGTIFKLTSSGSHWTESVFHTFTGALDGGNPYGGVTIDAAGNIYGTASRGGTGNEGIVFEITP
jgi:uncharacterized repeat protein (TIGR03803 family)